MAYIKKLKNNELIGGTDNTDVYPVTSTEAVYNKENVSQEYINNHVDGSKIVNGTITTGKIANNAVAMGKLDNEVQTLIQQGADSSWTPKGDFNIETAYDANDVVFDPATNSSYLSLRADNTGHPVDENDEEYEEGWWMKVLDGSYVNRAIEEMEAAIAQAIEDAQDDISELISDSQATINAAVSGANSAAQSANTAAANAEAKIDWVEEQVESLVAYEVDDELDEESIIPVQNKVVTQTIVPMDMYLKTGLETLVLGGVYVSGNAVKTSDGQMVEITRDIREFALNDAVTTGDLVAYFNNTYKALSDIGAYSGDDSDYSSGDYAIGTYSNLQMEVTAGTTSGTILVNGVEINIEEGETATEIASAIVSNITIDGWVLSSDDNVVTATCSTVGAKDLAVTFSANGTGVSIVQNLTLGSYTLRVFDGSAWSSATATNYLASNVWQALTITELEAYATKQDNLISYFEIEKGVSGRVTSVKGTARTVFNLPHLKKDKTYKVNLSSSNTAVFSRATFAFLRNANNTKVACYETNSSDEIEKTNFTFKDGVELNFTPKNEIDTGVSFYFWCASDSTIGVDINVNVSWKEYASSIEEKVECESAKYKETKYTTETRTIGNVAVGYIEAEPMYSTLGRKQPAPNGNTDYRITDYIDCENAKKLKTNIIQINGILFPNNRAGLVFYDADKNPIRTNFGYYCSSTGAYWRVYTIDVPSNAKYFRNSTWPQSWDYTFYYEKEGEEEQINALSEQVDDLSDRVTELEVKTEPIPEDLTSYEYTGLPISVNRFAGEKVINLSITHQGCASYGDYLFVGIANSARLYIFNLSNYSYIGSVTFGSYSISNTHANTLTFSNQRYESGDEFPVLYVCSGYGTGSSPTTFNVYGVRITRSGNTFSASIVKTIILTGTGGWTEFICADNKAWIKLETTENWKWYKVNMPTLESSNAIALDTLTPNFTTSKLSQYCQGHFYISGKIYIPEGRNNGTIRVMDMASGEIVTTVSLSFLSSLEPEGIFIYDGHFYLLFMGQVWKLYFT